MHRALTVVFAIIATSAALAHERPPTTAADRARLVRITKEFVADPLDETRRADREWALDLVLDSPDLHSTHCDAAFGPLVTTSYAYNVLLRDVHRLAQATTFGGRGIHAEEERNIVATHAVLSAYESIVRKRPNARSPELDTWIRLRDRGALDDRIRALTKQCVGP